MTKQNNFTLIKKAKQLAIEETKAKVLKLIDSGEIECYLDCNILWLNLKDLKQKVGLLK